MEDAHEQQNEISQANQEGAGPNGPAAGLLAPRSKPDLQLMGLPQPKLRDLDMQIHGCQKATQRMHKMKPSGVHMQMHVYKIKVMWA